MSTSINKVAAFIMQRLYFGVSFFKGENRLYLVSTLLSCIPKYSIPSNLVSFFIS